MHGVELPLAARIPVHHMPSKYYYRIPVRPNVKTYPIYVPGKEPRGYWDWLQQQKPQPAFDITSLRGIPSKGPTKTSSVDSPHPVTKVY
jgi:hypothetical protein